MKDRSVTFPLKLAPSLRLAAGSLAVAMVALLGGCSALETDKIDYKSASKGPSLDVPPNLTQLSRDNRYQIPGGPVTASSFDTGKGAQALPTAAVALGDVRIERAGNQRWLVVKRPVDKIWDTVRDFWQENGFLLTLDQSDLGIMETDWAENRAKLPQDAIRNTLGKIFDSLYSTGERDRFRTRVERVAGGSEVFITHRGAEEFFTGQARDIPAWRIRPNDPQLEGEMLVRLMAKLGIKEEVARTQVANAPAAPARARRRRTSTPTRARSRRR